MNTTLTFDEFVFPRRQRSLILLTMLLVFTLCWLPLNLINLMEDLEVELEVSDHRADPVCPGAAPVLALLLPHLLHLPRVGPGALREAVLLRAAPDVEIAPPPGLDLFEASSARHHEVLAIGSPGSQPVEEQFDSLDVEELDEVVQKMRDQTNRNYRE